MIDKYMGMTTEQYAAISQRYNDYLDACNDVTKEPVKVYYPLSKKALAELELIREVSKDLQNKKEEDMKKAAQAAEEQKEAERKAAEEKSEAEKKEETTETETQK